MIGGRLDKKGHATGSVPIVIKLILRNPGLWEVGSGDDMQPCGVKSTGLCYCPHLLLTCTSAFFDAGYAFKLIG